MINKSIFVWKTNEKSRKKRKERRYKKFIHKRWKEYKFVKTRYDMIN